MKYQIVSVNEFVRRQVKDSGKTYSDSLSFEDMAKTAEEQLNNGNFLPGYRDGVALLSVPNDLLHHFICPMVKITENTLLKAEYVKRQEDEEPYIRLRAISGKPMETWKVELIIYRGDVLLENNEQSTEADWELIAFHALPKGMDRLPMGPITMMRNQLQLTGGTKAEYSTDEWAESVRFWQKYAMLDA